MIRVVITGVCGRMGRCEQLSVVHRAHSPEAFAKGAIRAAKWVIDAPKGLHDVSEVLFQKHFSNY